MNASPGKSRIRRTGLLLAALGAAVAVAAPAHGGGAPPPQSSIDTASSTWAMKGYLLDARGKPVFDELPPLAAIRNAGNTWAAKARLLGAGGRPFTQTQTAAPAAGAQVFQWDDFGLGAGAVFGLVLVAIGLGAGAHYGRRGRLREQRA